VAGIECKGGQVSWHHLSAHVDLGLQPAMLALRHELRNLRFVPVDKITEFTADETTVERDISFWHER
jgi:hypothetical protein